MKTLARRGCIAAARKGCEDFQQWRFQLHYNSVHWFRMKNITLSADEDLIERARSIARGQRRTLNAAFREWLAQFAQSAGDARGFDALMKQMQHVDAGGHFSRDDLNER